MKTARIVKTVSKDTFFTVVALTTTGLGLAELLVFALVLKLMIPRPHGPFPHFFSYASTLLCVDFLISVFAVDRLFKKLGSSRSGDSVETRERAFGMSKAFAADGEVVEFVLERSTFKSKLGTLVLAFPCSLFLIYGFPNDPAWMLVGYVFAAFIIVQVIRQVFAWDGCVVRVDERGVFGFPSRFALRRAQVPWSEIATCDIVTRHNTFGAPCLIVPVFRDEFGGKLISVDLQDAPMEYQERLVKDIKARLPKARVELGED